MNSKKQSKKNRSSKIEIDWTGVRQRINDSLALIERGFSPTEEEKKEILLARTQKLSKEPIQKQNGQKKIQIVEFLLASERYGIETSYIREIYPLKELTPLPGTPDFILGIVNVRGRILSVIDLKKFFDLPEKGLTDFNKLIILNEAEMEFGILGDVILGVREVSAEDIQPSLPTLTGIREEYLLGVTSERLILLDGQKILSDKKMKIE